MTKKRHQKWYNILTTHLIINPFTHSGHYSGQLFKKHFLAFAWVFMAKVHINLYIGPGCIILYIKLQAVFSLQTKMVNGQSEMPSCSGISTHSFYPTRLLQVKKKWIGKKILINHLYTSGPHASMAIIQLQIILLL